MMQKAKNIWQKNRSDFNAFMSGRLQKVLNNRRPSEKDQQIPVFYPLRVLGLQYE